jgi:hypothetical protein
LAVAALPPVLGWFGTHVVGRVPAGPFLALTPARTDIGRSLTAAILLSGSIGLIAYLSLAVGTWVLVLALIAAAAVAVGCGRAFATYWWPVALAGSLLGMGLVLAYGPAVSPWAFGNEPEMLPLQLLLWGGLTVVFLAFWASYVTINALDALAEIERNAERRRGLRRLRP